jgi:outer membrane protein
VQIVSIARPVLPLNYCLRIIVALSSLAFCLIGARAADLSAPASPPGWFVTIGLGPELQPSFPASKTFTVWPIGHFEYARPGDPPTFSAPDDGFDIALLNLGWFKAGPVARVIPSRGLSNGNENFYGLHNIGWSLELGGFAEVWTANDHLRTRVELRQAVNGHNGLEANVEIDAVDRLGPWTLSLGPRLALGNSTYMNAYFSVRPYEAALNKLVYPYQASGGVTSFGGVATVKYDISRNWSVTLFGGYDRFVNSAADSPIPNRLGTLSQFKAGGILAYSFNFGGIGLFGY